MIRSRVRGYLRGGAALLALFALTLAFMVYGCSGGDGGAVQTGSSGGGDNPPPPATTATVEFDFDLATSRAVPASVTAFRISGYDAEGNLVYGPVERAKATPIVLEDVPVEVASLRLEYLEGDTLVGLWAEAVDLAPGEVKRYESPDYEDLPAASVTIEVSPDPSSVAAGLQTSFEAVAVFTGGFRQEATSDATWSTGNEAVATVSDADGSKGVATGVAPGETTVSATYAGVTGSADLTVTAAQLVSLAVTPPNPNVPAGRTQQFQATGTFSDDSTADVTTQVNWTSSNTGRATISNADGSKGLATGVSAGTATITATHAGTGVSGSTGITVTSAELVSIEVTPATPSVAKGRTQQFVATGTFSDNSNRDITAQVNWTSNNEPVASVSNLAGSRGLASTHSVGSATITATDPTTSLSDGAELTVTAAVLESISVTPANDTLALGLNQQYTATGVFSDSTNMDLTQTVTWSSSNTGVATISNGTGDVGVAGINDPPGFVRSVAVGTTTITALDPTTEITGNTGLTVSPAEIVSVAVTPTNPSVAKGRSQQFTATGTFTDGSNDDVTADVTWSSSDESKATISNAVGSKGLASTVGVGQTQITATVPGGEVQGSTTLEVTAAVLDSIAVTPTNSSVANGQTQQFTATGTFSDNTVADLTTQVTWSSSDEAKATISNVDGTRGLATAHAVGSTTITATDAGSGKSGDTTLTVTAGVLTSIEVTPADQSLPKGRTLQYTATGTFSDGSSDDVTSLVTWTSTNTAAATISANGGLASAVAVGGTTIRATHPGTGVQGSTGLTVTAAVLDSLEVTPANPSVADGLTQQFTATGTFSDGTQSNITTTVTWSSSDETKATISNVAGTKGLATAVAPGTTTITATDSASGVTNNTTLTVTAAVLQSIAVTPANSTVVEGATKQYTATGTFSDGSQSNITTTVTWSSSDTGKATISNAGGSKGLATGVAAGTTTITALDPGTNVSGSTGLTVTAAPQPEITVQYTSKCGFTEIPQEVVGMTVRWVNQDTFQQVTGTLDAEGKATFTREQITPGVSWSVQLLAGASGCGSASSRTGCWDGTHTNWGSASGTPTGETNGLVRLYIACPSTCQQVPAPPFGYDAAWGNQSSGCAGQ